MRIAVAGLFISLSLLCCSTAWASPEQEVAQAFSSRAQWTTHTLEGISFSAPPRWTLEDNAVMGRALLEAPRGRFFADQALTMVISVTPSSGLTLTQSVENSRGTMLDRYEPYTNPPSVRSDEWRATAGGQV
jgi:hypothetical protein